MSFPIPTPSVLDRSRGFMTLQYINDANILGYRVRVARTLDDAYGNFNGVGGAGTDAIFDVDRGRTFITRAIRDRRTAIAGDTTRGQTRAYFDPNEYFGVTAQVPSDNELWFVRTQIRTVASPAFPGAPADNTNQSIIKIIQDPEYFNVPRPALTVSGTAPSLAAAVAGSPPPPGAMVFVTPAFADAIIITNHDAAIPLFFGAGLEQPLMEIDPQTIIMHGSGMKDELVVCATGGNPKFSMLLSTVTGRR